MVGMANRWSLAAGDHSGDFRSADGPRYSGCAGAPVETGSHLPVALWFIGAVILGLALAYGIKRNRRRNIAEKRVTDQATKGLYAEEERDRAKSRRSF